MEAIRSYIPKLRVPSLSQLRDGSFLSRAIQKYEEEAEHSIIRDFEVRMRPGEIEVWVVD